MEKYKILEHISDLKIKVFGRDKKDLFRNTIIGMFEGARYEPFSATASENKGEDKEIEREIKISSPDLSSLLVDFLSEALYLSEVNHEVYNNIQFKKFSDPSADSEQAEIEGILFGKKLKRIGVAIKGVTYNNLDIHQEKDGSWQVTILFDI